MYSGNTCNSGYSITVLFQWEGTCQFLDYQVLEAFHLQIVIFMFVVCKLLVLNMLFKITLKTRLSYNLGFFGTKISIGQNTLGMQRFC